jgi:hypothetical protein
LIVNLIEKVLDWQPTRDLILHGLLKDVMPKVEAYDFPIQTDIKEPNCVQTFATYYDTLVNTNVLEEFLSIKNSKQGYRRSSTTKYKFIRV